MALNISSSQIYAGRYHYKRPEIPNLLDTQKYTASTPGKSVKEATGVDTVTISDEGLAKAKDWREYTKDNENISHTGVNPKEELYKKLGLSKTKKTTDDMMFTVETVSCLGACGLAPTMMVNEEVYPRMTPEKADELIDKLRGGEQG